MREYFAPKALRNLPFVLQRDKLYPPEAAKVATAAQSYVDSPPDQPQQILPRNMLYTRWKSNVPYGSNVYGLLAALQGEMDMRASLEAAQRQTPRLTMSDVADPMNAIPQPTLVNETQYGSRDVTPLDQLISVDQLEEYVKGSEEQKIVQQATVMAGKARAMSQIQAKQDGYASIVRLNQRTPWAYVNQE